MVFPTRRSAWARGSSRCSRSSSRGWLRRRRQRALDAPTPRIEDVAFHSAWSLGWRTLWRDLRGGELRLLIVAVTLAVAALTAVGFFADRLDRGLARDARQLLGGDAVVSSDRPTPEAIVAEARRLGLRSATMTTFPSMGRAGQA